MPSIKLSPDQQAANDALEAGRSVFITGGAGTGKSTLVKEFCRGRKVARLATTGAASVLIGGQTIHSFFKISPYIHKPGSIRDSQGVDFRTMKRVAAFDTILIDEISMARVDTFQAIIETLGRVRKMRNGRPFQLVAVGDFAQLPPVITREERPALRQHYGDLLFAFEHPAWNSLEPHALSVIHRQSGDPTFAHWLSEVRRGNFPHAGYVNQRVGPPPPGAVRLVTTNESAKRLNEAEMNKLPTRDIIISGEIGGDFNQKNARVPQSYRMREGARVIICYNNPFAGYVNGSTGTLMSVNGRTDDPERQAIVRLDNGKTVAVTPATWENVSYEQDHAGQYEPRVRGSFRQLPLLPGWAITVHRSQGMSLDRVHADLRNSFEAGQAYVALSRATSLEGLTLEAPIDPVDLAVNPKIAAYHDRIMRPDKPEADVSGLSY